MKKKGIQDKTINELRAEARKEGITLRLSMKKQDILNALRKKKARKASGKRAVPPAKSGIGLKMKKSTAAKTLGEHAPVKETATATKKDSRPALPQEYGENDLFLIVVDPDVVFANWEIRREDLPRQRSGLTMRLFDVTESGPGGQPQRVIDIDVPGRVGSGFFTIRMPGRDIVAEMGFRRDGRFQPILRSNMVSFPLPMHYYESGLPDEPETGPPIGY